MNANISPADCDDGVPYPIVALNRGVIVGGVLLGLWLDQPLLTTAILALLAPAALFGRRGSLIFRIGSALFKNTVEHAPREDARIQRFNNTIAVILLSGAQIAFLVGTAWLGWVFSVAVAFAALVALCGFCMGCFLYYPFRVNKTLLVPIQSRKRQG